MSSKNYTKCAHCKEKHGLKDHEISILVNNLRDKLQPYVKFQCLREQILRVVIEYLEKEGLRIDKKYD